MIDLRAQMHIGYITTENDAVPDIRSQMHLGYMTNFVVPTTVDLYDGMSATLTVLMPNATVEC